MDKILVTGGTGYIASHTCVELLQEGHELVVVDNFSNSKAAVLDRIKRITGRSVSFYQLDVRDHKALDDVFNNHGIEAVIHFAGFKAVGESVARPLLYYRNNLDATLTLCEVMQKHHVKRLVFSSSATVYGIPETVPIPENARLFCTNPYGWTKLMNEQILTDLAAADPAWSVVLLRYFNPIGAHPSGLIGEDPAGIPNNLMPYVAQVAVGRRPFLQVFGDDYPTPDGTGVRDYIHVVDLARGHCRAIDYTAANPGAEAVNLGTGRGYSVLELVQAFEQASGRTIPYQIVGRRAGDIAESFADPSKAKTVLGWQAVHSLADMCADTWRWQSANPEGYGE
ncbi:MAG: UDP-glucose 4-epimerase GalE [Saccharofermentanales bacterium]